MNVSECCYCPHSGMPRCHCLCLCHRSIERDRCQSCGYLTAQCHCPTVIADFARELNPRDGALADALPFALTPPTSPTTSTEQQPDLFTKEPKP